MISKKFVEMNGTRFGWWSRQIWEVIRVWGGCKKLGPSENDSVEFGPDHLQQLWVEEVLTQAEGAPVTSAHAAQPGMSEETYGKYNTIFTYIKTHKGKRDKTRVIRCHHHEMNSLWLITWEAESTQDFDNNKPSSNEMPQSRCSISHQIQSLNPIAS